MVITNSLLKERKNTYLAESPIKEAVSYKHYTLKELIEMPQKRNDSDNFRRIMNTMITSVAGKSRMKSNKKFDWKAYDEAETIRVFEQPAMDYFINSLEPMTLYEGSKISAKEKEYLEASDTVIMPAVNTSYLNEDGTKETIEMNDKEYEFTIMKPEGYHAVREQSEKIKRNARQERIDSIMERSNQRVKNRGLVNKVRSLFRRK